MDRILRRDHDKTEGNHASLKMQDSKPNKKHTTTEEDHLHLTLPPRPHQTKIQPPDSAKP